MGLSKQKQVGTKVPAIRFDGYTDEWTETKLGDVVSMISSPLRAKDLTVGGDYPVYNANDLIGYHDTYLSDSDYISIIKDGAGVGRIRVLDGFTNVTGTMNGLIPNDEFDLNFTQNCIGLVDFTKYIVGTTIPHIYYKDYKLENMSTPILEEQILIGNFFKTIDDLISAEKEQLENYEQYKEAMLQKMFPKKGDVVPEVRFDGFTDDWVETKLGDVGYFLTSSINKKMIENDSVVSMVNYLDVYNQKNITNGNLKNLMQVTANENQIVNNGLLKGDILFTPSSETPDDIGHSMVILEDLLNTVYSYHLLRFRPDIELDINYSNYFCNITPVRNQIIKFATGSTRFTVSLRNFSKIVVTIPTLEEQILIGDFFKTIDDLIRAKSNRVDELTQMKESFLQKMFV